MFFTLAMIRSEWMRALLAAHLHRLEIRERGRRWELSNPDKLKAKQYRANHSAKGKAKQWRYNRTEKSKQRLQRYAERHPGRIQETQHKYNLTPKSKVRHKKHRMLHLPKIKERERRYRQSENGRLKSQLYRVLNRDKIRAREAGRPKSEASKLKAKAWYALNKDKRKEQSRLWRKRNPDKMRALWSATQKRRYATSPQFRLMKHYRSRTAKAFKAQGTKMSASASKLMGCTWAELRAHIESKFKPGMTWENYGYRTWHVDHVRPIEFRPYRPETSCGMLQLQESSTIDGRGKYAKVG